MSLDGTIIRVDPDTGVGLPGNPFASSADHNARRIIAYGLRNPFRFGLRPGTQQLWVGDVGWNTWEEINRVADVDDGVAENFGWPCYEGAGRQGGYDGANLNRCESLYAGAGQTGPFYTYDHGAQVVPGDACPVGTSSITGIAFEDGSNYPADYDGALFFADAARGCIWVMKRGGGADPAPGQISQFVGGGGSVVQVLAGPGGDIFYVDLWAGQIHRVVYNGANHPPTAVVSASPTSGTAPLTVRFDGSRSHDLDAGQLTYAWDLDGDGQYDDSTAVSPTLHVHVERHGDGAAARPRSRRCVRHGVGHHHRRPTQQPTGAGHRRTDQRPAMEGGRCRSRSPAMPATRRTARWRRAG